MYFTLAEAEARTEVPQEMVGEVVVVLPRLGLLEGLEQPTQAEAVGAVTAPQVRVEQVVPVLLSLGTQRTLLQHRQ
jgi:hypothetical protein